jgi:lambda family phage minor tail protein L
MIYALSKPEIIDLYALDLSPIGAAIILRFFDQEYSDGSPAAYQGNEYTPYPITASGFELRQAGALPSPEIRVSNALGALSLLIVQNGGLEGARIRRIRIWENNLAGQSAAGAPPLQEQSWDVARTSESQAAVTLFLKHPLDKAGAKVPRRRMSQLFEE